MLYSFFITQWYKPSKGDWTEQIKLDLEEFNIPIDLEYISSKSKDSFKKIVKRKSKELALRKLLKSKANHSKMTNLEYDTIQMQNYFLREDVKIEQKRLIFKYRTRMAEFGENFRAGRHTVMCPFCDLHLDSQDLGAKCLIMKTHMKIIGNISDVYSEHISNGTIETIEKISEYRKQNLPIGPK